MSISVIKRRYCDSAPLSVQQRNIWVEHELYPDNVSYNIISILRLSGDLNTEAFRKTLTEIVRRHEVFCTTFTVDESAPRQIIQKHIEVSISEKTLNTLSSEEQEAEIKQLVYKESQLPFDLERGPLFRFTLLSLNKNEYVFLMTIHHLVMDGWSIGLFANELSTVYEAFCNNMPVLLPEVGIQYSDYAIWQNENDEKSQKCNTDYWNDVIKDAVFGEFPADYPRVFGKKGEGAVQTVTIPADMTAELKSFSLAERSTLFITLLAGFKLLLHRYTEQDNLLVGCYVAGRDQSETRELLGPYSNLAAIKTELSGKPNFRELLKRTRRAVFDTYSHGQLSISDISGQQGTGNSLSSTLFSVVFNYQNFPYPSWKLYNLDVSPEPITTGTVGFDMEISIVPVNRELAITAKYRKDIYSENTIKRILRHYVNILSSATNNPELPTHILPLMSSDEIRQIVEDWNSEKIVYQTDATIHRLIDASSKKNPTAVALTCNERDVSYEKLANLSNHIARFLIKTGVGPEVMVGVCMERSQNLIITLLAILKAGGVYVPLDPIYPEEKLLYMLQNSNAQILLTEKRQVAKFPAFDGKTIEIESLISQSEEDAVCAPPLVNISSENSAYLIYTSGSTGKPKGVLVSHRNVCNSFCFADLHMDDVDSSRTWLFGTSISFDPSVLEMFWTLSRGYRVVILPNDSSGKFLDIDVIPELISTYNVSHFQCTPSILRVLMNRADGIAALKQLRKLMVGGECFPVGLAKRLSAETSIDVFNVYGPTETTLWATWHRIHKDDSSIPIGRPLPNYEIYILDEDSQPRPVGAYGEVYIGGAGVARGYFNDPELTAQKYLPNPFVDRSNERIYRTGDIARYRDNGIIEFLGRADRQVKIRGHRIEPGEVEAAIMDSGQVRETVVIASGNSEMDQKLLGYIIPDVDFDDSEESDLFVTSLKEALHGKLPGFMIPASLTVMKEFPKLSNGKIDRKLLPIQEMPVNATKGSKKELSSTENTLMKIWEDVLGYAGFGVNDNYIAIGGDSLAAIIIINRIKSLLKVKITISDILNNSTVKQLAELVELRAEDTVPEPSDEIIVIDRNDDIPLSYLQEGRLKYEFSMDVGGIPYLHNSAWFNLKLSGNLDFESLEKAFNYVINRHEVFRTEFRPMFDVASPAINKWNAVLNTCRMNPLHYLPKVQFKQFIHSTVKMKLDYYDVSEYNKNDKDIEINVLAEEIVQGRYTYESPPLTRAVLIRTAVSEHILIVASSHLIADALSMRIYERELAYAYSSLVDGQAVKLPDVELQYADYVAWMKRRSESGSLDSIKFYWQKQFEGYVPTDIMILPFANTDVSEYSTYFNLDAKYYYHPISDELGDAIRKYAGSMNVTLFSVAMTGFILCLYDESGKEDIGVLTFFANRTNPKTEDSIGLFMTGNIIRVKINPDDLLYQCVTAVSESLDGAIKNQDLIVAPPDSRVIKSLYDFVVSLPITCELLTDDACASFSGLHAQRVIIGRNKSEYALRLFVIDSGKKLSLMFQYNLGLFDGENIQGMAERTEYIIKEIVENPLKTALSVSI